MGQKFRNNFSTTLTSTINTTSVTLELDTAPSPAIVLTAADDHFLLTLVDKNGNREVVKCVGISTKTVTIGTALGVGSLAGRAQEDTTAIEITYTDSHVVAMRATRGTFKSILDDIDTLEADTTVASTLQAETGTDDVQPLSSAKGREMVNAYIPVPSQNEAETGTENTKRMTPLRVMQAISKNAQLVSDTTPELGGNLTQGEFLTLFDPVIGTDLKYSGIAFADTVDSNDYGVGTPLYCAADGNYEPCDANVSATMPCRCLALETGTGSKLLLLKGFVRDDTWSWPSVGQNIYVSGTIGTLTQTAPSSSGDVVQVVG